MLSIPLNLFVVVLLLKIKYLSPDKVFMVCTAAHALSFLCYYHFYASTKQSGHGEGMCRCMSRIVSCAYESEYYVCVCDVASFCCMCGLRGGLLEDAAMLALTSFVTGLLPS